MADDAFKQATATAAFMANNSPLGFGVCVDRRDLKALSTLIVLSQSSEPWMILLGFRMALRTLGILLPSTFAMMLGTFKGCCIAKCVVRYSRIPGLVLTCSVVFTMPFLMLCLSVLNSSLGDSLLLLAMVCFLGANL